MNARQPRRTRDIRRFARRLSDERGFALPTTMLMLLAAFATVSVGVASTILVQRGTVRDQGTKTALQLAQTGVNQALLQFNKITPSDTNPCSPVTPATGPDASGWCQSVGPITDANGGTFTYRVHPYDVMVNGAVNKKVLEVVGIGQYGDASRRVLVRAESLAQNIFSDAAVKTSTGITLDSNSTIHSTTATNGDIVLGSNARQCGNASVGVGRGLVLNGNSGYFSDPNCSSATSTVNQQQLVLPTVNQGDAATHNDNGLLFSQDVISGNKADACFNGLNGNGQADSRCRARELLITNTSAVTLTGGTYSFCKLTMSSNSSLYVAAGHTVAIYFDSPENCYPGTSTPVTQLSLDSNTRITSTAGSPANLALLFVGSPTPGRSLISLSSNTAAGTNCQQNYVIYAPLSDIDMNSYSTYCGALGARTLHLDSNADIRPSTNPVDLQLPPVSPHYSSPSFKECTVASGATPTAGC